MMLLNNLLRKLRELIRRRPLLKLTLQYQEEVKDLAPAEVLNKRTRSGKQAKPSPPQPAQPSIPTKKRKHVVRKLKTAPEEEEDIEEATKLVSREVRRRKETDSAVKKAL